MIAFIKGKFVSLCEEGVVVDIGNVGVNVRVTDRMLELLPEYGEELMLYTYTHVKEDAFLLYGFESQTELSLFKKFLTVNGVGPKGALSILSIMPVNELKLAIASGDSKAIAKANGVGAKTAQRLILELKDKIDLEDALSDMLMGESGAKAPTGVALTSEKQDAIEALVALGYSQSEATKAVRQVAPEITDADDILKAALKFIF